MPKLKQWFGSLARWKRLEIGGGGLLEREGIHRELQRSSGVPLVFMASNCLSLMWLEIRNTNRKIVRGNYLRAGKTTIVTTMTTPPLQRLQEIILWVYTELAVICVPQSMTNSLTLSGIILVLEMKSSWKTIHSRQIGTAGQRGEGGGT